MVAHAAAQRFVPETDETSLELVPSSGPESNWAMTLQELQPNWDGEDAPAPSTRSISDAKGIVDWLEQHDLSIESVDADVLGGVDIYLNGTSGRTAWLAILNEGERSIVLSQNDKASGLKLDEIALEEMKAFLLGGGRGSTH